MKNNNEFGNKKRKVYGFSSDIKQKRLGNNQFHYTVNDINHVKVKDKTNPLKTYDTDAYFMCFYPIDRETKFENRINEEGKSKIRNITCFTTNADGKIMQNNYCDQLDDIGGFCNGLFGYVLEDFTTDGIFINNSNSNDGKTPAGKRINSDKTKEGDISTLKNINRNFHYEQNPYNLTINDDPVFKLIEKTMRYYNSYTDKNSKIDFDLIKKKFI